MNVEEAKYLSNLTASLEELEGWHRGDLVLCCEGLLLVYIDLEELDVWILASASLNEQV